MQFVNATKPNIQGTWGTCPVPIGFFLGFGLDTIFLDYGSPYRVSYPAADAPRSSCPRRVFGFPRAGGQAAPGGAGRGSV